MMQHLITLLHEGNYSCVLQNQTGILTFTQRGVADLYDLYENEPASLKNSSVADKVVGKAAAALLILGRAKSVYTDVISLPALHLLQDAALSVKYKKKVPFIENRDKTGYCPLESTCLDIESATDIYLAIKQFITQMRAKI